MYVNNYFVVIILAALAIGFGVMTLNVTAIIVGIVLLVGLIAWAFSPRSRIGGSYRRGRRW